MTSRDWRRAHQKGEARIKERWQRAGLTEREAAKRAKQEQEKASKKAIAIQREKQ